MQITASPLTTRSPWLRTARWVATFVGFPLGGLAATLLVGPVDSPITALVGGALTGSILGVVQGWGLGGSRRGGPPILEWVAATALGLMIGLGIGTATVDYRTSLAALMIQGAISGLAVGAGQAFVLRRRLGRLALAWPPALAAIWALGWTITTAVGVQVDEQFTVFGAAGAITVTAITAVLPLVIDRRTTSTEVHPVNRRHLVNHSSTISKGAQS